MRFQLLTQALNNALALLMQARPTHQSGLAVHIEQGRNIRVVGSSDTGKIPLVILNTDEQVIICRLLGMDAQPLPATVEDSSVADAYIAQVEKSADLQLEIVEINRQLSEYKTEVVAMNRTIEKLRNASRPASEAPATAAAPTPALSRVAFAVSFPIGKQSKIIASASMVLGDLKEVFKFKFEDPKDPTKGGRWEPLEATDRSRSMAKTLEEHGAMLHSFAYSK